MRLVLLAAIFCLDAFLRVAAAGFLGQPGDIKQTDLLEIPNFEGFYRETKFNLGESSIWRTFDQSYSVNGLTVRPFKSTAPNRYYAGITIDSNQHFYCVIEQSTSDNWTISVLTEKPNFDFARVQAAARSKGLEIVKHNENIEIQGAVSVAALAALFDDPAFKASTDTSSVFKLQRVPSRAYLEFQLAATKAKQSYERDPSWKLDQSALAKHLAKYKGILCDLLASSPSDTTRPSGLSGVELHQIQASRAIEACEAAASSHPDIPRYFFNLGRAYDAAKNFERARLVYGLGIAAGIDGARHNLATMLLNGDGGAKDEHVARQLMQTAAENGYVASMLGLGNLLFEGKGGAKDVAKAIDWYEKAATGGNRVAMILLAARYFTGDGVATDFAKGLAWRLRAQQEADGEPLLREGGMRFTSIDLPIRDGMRGLEAEAAKGNAAAQNDLGVLLWEGVGSRVDRAEALKWLVSSAEQHNRDAELNLFFLKGRGRPFQRFDTDYLSRFVDYADHADAKVWLERAAVDGDVLARRLLARVYAVARESPEKSKALKLAFDGGDADAAIGLGTQAFRAWDAKNPATAPRLEEADRILRPLALAGNHEAERRMGWLAEKGNPPRRAEAVAWYEKASAGGNAYASYDLGMLYLGGEHGVVRDEALATKWLTLAADRGYASAHSELARLSREGDFRDLTAAWAWTASAAEFDDESSTYQLAYLYHWGIGIDRDDAKAIAWLDRASHAALGRDDIALELCLAHSNESGKYGFSGLPEAAKDLNKAKAYCDKIVPLYGVSDLTKTELTIAQATAVRWLDDHRKDFLPPPATHRHTGKSLCEFCGLVMKRIEIIENKECPSIPLFKVCAQQARYVHLLATTSEAILLQAMEDESFDESDQALFETKVKALENAVKQFEARFGISVIEK